MSENVRPLTYRRPGGGRFQISPGALAQMLKYVQDAPRKLEAGGVLLGRYILGTPDVVVDFVTEPMPGDRRTRTRFFRHQRGHQTTIERTWRESVGTCTWLGEWHSHPESDPEPSCVDCADWRRKLFVDRYDEALFFVIVGTHSVCAWEGTLTSLEKPLGTLHQLEHDTLMPDIIWKKGKKRPKIPLQVERELWGRAAGRCEFRGCNEPLFRDTLTQGRSNLATIAHIVSWTKNGPRGDEKRSAALATDINNLILTCKKHGKYIDDREREEEYSEERLLDFKREHEERVRILTGLTEDAQTHVVFFRAPVDGRDHAINERKAHEALLPLYPAEEHPFDIDLAGVGVKSSSAGFYELLAEATSQQLKLLLTRRAGHLRPQSLSVFAIAPVPLLVHLGHLIGDIQNLNLFQQHRNRRGWKWADDEEPLKFYELEQPNLRLNNQDAPVVVVLSISAPVRRDLLRRHFERVPLVYEMFVPGVKAGIESGRDFLKSATRLEVFSSEFRNLLDVLRGRHGHKRPVHLFAAVPAPIAIEAGRNIKDVDPPFIIYDYQKKEMGYAQALIINGVI